MAPEMKLKIPTRTVPSDDCLVYVGRVMDEEHTKIIDEGEPVAVHVGESVDVIPVQSFATSIAIGKLTNFAFAREEITEMLNEGSELEAGRRAIEAFEVLELSYKEILDILAERLIRWTWTDMFGEPLDQPWRNPDVLHGLTTDEFRYLISVIQGNTEAQRKNGLEPSVNSS